MTHLRLLTCLTFLALTLLYPLSASAALEQKAQQLNNKKSYQAVTLISAKTHLQNDQRYKQVHLLEGKLLQNNIAAQSNWLSPDPLFLSDPEAVLKRPLEAMSGYQYAMGNPVNGKDPSGNVTLDTGADAAFLTYDVISWARNVAAGDFHASATDSIAMVLDTVCLVTPFLTGLGSEYRAYRAGEEAAAGIRYVYSGSEKAGQAVVKAEQIGLHSNGTNNFYRYVTKGEINAINETGKLRGGIPGETFFTKDIYNTGTKAQQRLSLPNKPTHRIEFQINNSPKLERSGSKVEAAFGQPGKGSEFMTKDSVEVNIINIQPLRP